MQMKPNTLRNKRNPRWSRCVHTRTRHDLKCTSESKPTILESKPCFWRFDPGSIPSFCSFDCRSDPCCNITAIQYFQLIPKVSCKWSPIRPETSAINVGVGRYTPALDMIWSVRRNRNPAFGIPLGSKPMDTEVVRVRSLCAPRVVSIPGVSIPPYAWILCVS